LVSIAVSLGVAVLLGGIVGLAVGALAAVATWVVVGRMEPPAARRRREELEAALPHVVDLMAASLTVGLSPETAALQVGHVVDGPIRDELAALHARIRWGSDPAEAWRALATHPQLAPLGRSVVRAVATGASVAEAMHRLADDLREDRKAGVESAARTVGVKAAAPLGLCLLPAFVLVGVVPLVAGSVELFTGR